MTVATWAREQDAARAMSEWAVRRVVGGDGSGSSRTRAADEPCGGGRDARAERYGPVRYAVKKKEMGQRRSCVMHRVWSDESGRASERACAVVECRGRMPEWTCDVRRGRRRAAECGQRSGWAEEGGDTRRRNGMIRESSRHMVLLNLNRHKRSAPPPPSLPPRLGGPCARRASAIARHQVKPSSLP